MNMCSYNCCTKGSSDSKQLHNLIPILKLVSEESRLRLLCLLNQNEHCVCELMEHVDMSQSLISHHLKDLREAGIVRDQKKGQFVYYSLTTKGKQITQSLLSINP